MEFALQPARPNLAFNKANAHGEEKKMMNFPNFLGDQAVRSSVVKSAFSLPPRRYSSEYPLTHWILQRVSRPQPAETPDHPSSRAADWEISWRLTGDTISSFCLYYCSPEMLLPPKSGDSEQRTSKVFHGPPKHLFQMVETRSLMKGCPSSRKSSPYSKSTCFIIINAQLTFQSESVLITLFLHGKDL